MQPRLECRGRAERTILRIVADEADDAGGHPPGEHDDHDREHEQGRSRQPPSGRAVDIRDLAGLPRGHQHGADQPRQGHDQHDHAGDAGDSSGVPADPAECCRHDLTSPALPVRLVGMGVPPVRAADQDDDQDEQGQEAPITRIGVFSARMNSSDPFAVALQKPLSAGPATGGRDTAEVRPSSTCQVIGVAHWVLVTGPVGPLLNDGSACPQRPV